jgi:hypothetical protein
VSRAPRPGDTDWRPDPASLPKDSRSDPSLTLRVLSVVPFMLAGAIGVIAVVAWLAVLVLGIGIDRGTVWQWAAGQPFGVVITQLGLLILVGVACAALVVGSIYATGIGFGTVQPRWFWALAEAICVALALALVAGKTVASDAMASIGLTGRDWFFALGVVVFSAIVIRMRHRRATATGE